MNLTRKQRAEGVTGQLDLGLNPASRLCYFRRIWFEAQANLFIYISWQLGKLNSSGMVNFICTRKKTWRVHKNVRVWPRSLSFNIQRLDLKEELKPPTGTCCIRAAIQSASVATLPCATSLKRLHYIHEGHGKQTLFKKVCWESPLLLSIMCHFPENRRPFQSNISNGEAI